MTSSLILPKHFQLYINGQWVDSKDPKTKPFEVVNPATESVIARLQEAGKVSDEDWEEDEDIRVIAWSKKH